MLNALYNMIIGGSSDNANVQSNDTLELISCDHFNELYEQVVDSNILVSIVSFNETNAKYYERVTNLAHNYKNFKKMLEPMI